MSYTPPNPYVFVVESGYPTPEPWVFVAAGSGQDVRIPVLAPLSQQWALTEAVTPLALVQPWGVKMGVDLIESWSDAPVIRSGLSQYWGDGTLLRGELIQRWRDAVPLRLECAQPYFLMADILADLSQPWAITAGVAAGSVEQPWSIRDVELLTLAVQQPWAIASDGSVLRYTVSIMADGQPVRVSHVSIEGGRDQDVLTCELHPETEAEYLLCPFGAALQVTLTSNETTESFMFVVTSPRITEQHGDTRYVVEAMSQAVFLGEPYAGSVEGELSGLASEIAGLLVAGTGVTIHWNTVDWYIPPATWIAAGETPLALLKQLANAAGAVVQSRPDGSISIEPSYPVAVPQWPVAPPDNTLVETLDCFTTGSTPEYRQGYNRFYIGDQIQTTDSLRLETTDKGAALCEVRGYQTPWLGNFSLTHTGGDWVIIEPMGIEERQESEVVEFVAGAGRTKYPIYSRDAVTWQQVNLGSVTFAEDGTLEAAVDGQSLLAITYTTRFLLWRVRNPRNEQLQLVAEL